jgi:Fic family protein
LWEDLWLFERDMAQAGKFSKTNAKLAKQYEKLFQSLNSAGATEKTIKNRINKLNETAKKLIEDGKKAIAHKAKEEAVKKGTEETQKKVRGVE